MMTRIKGIVFMIIVVLLVSIVLPMANTASVQPRPHSLPLIQQILEELI